MVIYVKIGVEVKAMRVLTFSVLRRCKARLWRPRPAVEGPAPGSRALCSQPEPAATTGSTGTVTGTESLVAVHPSWPAAEQAELRGAALRGLRVLPAFVSEAEEAALLAELEPVLRRMRYEFDHWDNAIQGYRETERGAWSAANQAVLARARAAAFPAAGPDSRLLPAAHVLDLAAAGHIRPHVDAVRFCGGVIAGLCLVSDAVMRLQHQARQHLALDALLPRRCLYIMSGVSRYEFTHAVLGGEDSAWRGQRVPRRRRVAVILRSRPAPQP